MKDKKCLFMKIVTMQKFPACNHVVLRIGGLGMHSVHYQSIHWGAIRTFPGHGRRAFDKHFIYSKFLSALNCTKLGGSHLGE